MSRSAAKVSFKPADPSQLPDALSRAAVLLIALQRRGVLDTLGEALKIRRQGGYSGLDLWIFLMAYFASDPSDGIKTFYRDTLKPVKRHLAALAGRKDLPSSSSASRALAAVEIDLLRPVTHTLLMNIADVDDLLRHPAVFSYDARGERWHLFDVDGTVSTLRHRALPLADDLPEPSRRSEDMASPGYSGRKRGDVQFDRMTVQHAGSGLWTWAHLGQGNGAPLQDLELALDSMVECCKRLDFPLHHTLARMDGEAGNVPCFTACRERDVLFITRLNRPALFEDPEVLHKLREAIWYQVADSGSGPRRVAADLGEMTIKPGKKTRRPDGTVYEPITIRVVASAYVSDNKKTNRGKLLDGWQVELFVADLDPVAWPAPEVIVAYFGRAGQENRFAQEDRELHLDRIISYHLPGQELATLVALSLWNLRVVEGFAAHRPVEEAPRQTPYTPVVDARMPAQWPHDPALARSLDKVVWEEALARRPGWSWNSAQGEIRCPEGRLMTPTTIRPTPSSSAHTSLIFRRPVGGCEDCSAREGCLRSSRPLAPKHAEVQVESALAEVMRERLAEVRRVAAEADKAPTDPSWPPEALTVLPSLFLPARARQAFDALFVNARVCVEFTEPEAPPPRLQLVADSPAQRQRRRMTWQQNLDRYALDDNTSVAVEVSGGLNIERSLGKQQGHQAPLRGTG